MATPHIRSSGLTKTRARALDGQGYKFHMTRSIKQARPVTDLDLVMSPIADEGVTLYSFNTKADMDAFIEQHGGEPLV